MRQRRLPVKERAEQGLCAPAAALIMIRNDWHRRMACADSVNASSEGVR
jgi:hypothetical protein